MEGGWQRWIQMPFFQAWLRCALLGKGVLTGNINHIWDISANLGSKGLWEWKQWLKVVCSFLVGRKAVGKQSCCIGMMTANKDGNLELGVIITIPILFIIKQQHSRILDWAFPSTQPGAKCFRSVLTQRPQPYGLLSTGNVASVTRILKIL